jgi:putative aldouronate transport system substrate-binding protein
MLSSYNDLLTQYLTEEEQNYFRKDVLAWYAIGDKTYAYPNYAYSTEDLPKGTGLIPNRGIVFRQDLYKQIGSPDMSSPAGFLGACEKASKLTYNDLPVIGLQLYENGNEAYSIISQYFAVPWETKDGQAYNVWQNGENKESYAFLNEAYRRGLILESNFSDTRDQIREKIANGRVFALAAGPQDFSTEFQSLFDQDKEAYYIPEELHNAAGDDPTLTDISGWGYLQTVISSACKAPDRFIKLVSFLVGPDGSKQMAYGWEGEQWNYNGDGSISPTDSYVQAKEADPNLTKQIGIGAFDLYANFAYLMQFTPPLNLDDPVQYKDYRTNNNYIMQPLSNFSHMPAQYKYDPSDSRATQVQEEKVKEDNYLKMATAELMTMPTPEDFDAKFTEIQNTLPTICDIQLITQYDNDGLQAAKKQLGVSFFFPPYAK